MGSFLFLGGRKLGLGGRRQHGIRERARQRGGSIAVMARHGDGATGAAAGVSPYTKAKDVLALHAGGEPPKVVAVCPNVELTAVDGAVSFVARP